MTTTASEAPVCGLKPKNLPRPAAVSVNGVTIPRDAIARETQNHPAAKPVAAWLEAARALIVRELLLQEAKRLQVQAEPLTDDAGRRETEDEALIRALVDHAVVTPLADETTCRRYYDQNRGRFRSSDLYEVRHILIAAAPGDQAARADARALAGTLVAKLRGAPQAFPDLAALHSACPSSATGGSLGQISAGQTVPEFERGLASLPVGEVGAEPIETRYGLHVVLLDRRIEGRELPFELVRDAIARWLDDRVRHGAIRYYIAGLAAAAKIEGIELDWSLATN